MRVVFFGTPAYAVPSLDALVAAGHQILAVYAQPDKPSGRGQALQSPATALRARELGLELRQPKAVRTPGFLERLRALNADVAVVVAYGRILTAEVLAAPRLGCVNGHGSLLPRWRGAAPIQWSLLAGDAVTGVTTMQMDAGLDTGAMLLWRELAIGPDEAAPELSERLSALTAALVVETLARLESLVPVPQDESRATVAPPLTKEMGRLDWSKPAIELHNQVRALQPWPGTSGRFREQDLRVLRARVAPGSGRPGEVIEAGRRLVVACGVGALEVLVGQLPGKKALPAQDLVNGARVRVGEELS